MISRVVDVLRLLSYRHIDTRTSHGKCWMSQFNKVAVSRKTAQKLAWAWNPDGREQEPFWKWVVITVLNSRGSDGRKATQVRLQTPQAFPVTPLGSFRQTHTRPVQNQPPVQWLQSMVMPQPRWTRGTERTCLRWRQLPPRPLCLALSPSNTPKRRVLEPLYRISTTPCFGAHLQIFGTHLSLKNNLNPQCERQTKANCYPNVISSLPIIRDQSFKPPACALCFISSRSRAACRGTRLRGLPQEHDHSHQVTPFLHPWCLRNPVDSREAGAGQWTHRLPPKLCEALEENRASERTLSS